jgi:hypothetical protein
VVSKATRKFVRLCLLVVLVFCAILDGAMGEGAISGYGDVGNQNANGIWSLPGPDPSLWQWIAAFILIQGALIVAFFRLRDARHPQSLFHTKPNS